MTLLCSTHPVVRKDHREKTESWRSREASCGLGRACVGYRIVAQSPSFEEGKPGAKTSHGKVVYWVQEALRKNGGPDRKC